MKNEATKNRILQAGKSEFLEKGFANASLRQIAKNAQVTTGAIYGYYRDKNELFTDLVSPITRDFHHLHLQAIKATFQENPHTFYLQFPIGDLERFADFIFAHFSEFKLLLQAAAGTSQASYLHQLLETLGDAIDEQLTQLHLAGQLKKTINLDFIHILLSAYFSAIFEIVLHDMPQKEARAYLQQVRQFFDAGWQALLK